MDAAAQALRDALRDALDASNILRRGTDPEGPLADHLAHLEALLEDARRGADLFAVRLKGVGR